MEGSGQRTWEPTPNVLKNDRLPGILNVPETIYETSAKIYSPWELKHCLSTKIQINKYKRELTILYDELRNNYLFALLYYSDKSNPEIQIWLDIMKEYLSLYKDICKDYGRTKEIATLIESKKAFTNINIKHNNKIYRINTYDVIMYYTLMNKIEDIHHKISKLKSKNKRTKKL
mmetsp:Transcript_78992/g.96582  ORF Transcript_78992/g.96582 Transcript_78992/m.96582 type:complete len:174 (-) Transcript_78992:55-576(-)